MPSGSRPPRPSRPAARLRPAAAGAAALGLGLLLAVTSAAATPSPSPSPGPSPTPTAAASPSPDPSAAPSPAPSPTASPAPSPAAVASAPPAAPPAIVVGAGSTEITATSMRVGALTYAGTATVATPQGRVAVLQLSLGAAVFSDLDVKLPCSGHVRLEMSQPGTHDAGDLALGLTGFRGTGAGGTLAYTAAAPPAAQALGPGAFSDVTLVSVSSVAGSLSLQGAVFRAIAC